MATTPQRTAAHPRYDTGAGPRCAVCGVWESKLARPYGSPFPRLENAYVRGPNDSHGRTVLMCQDCYRSHVAALNAAPVPDEPGDGQERAPARWRGCSRPWAEGDKSIVRGPDKTPVHLNIAAGSGVLSGPVSQ